MMLSSSSMQSSIWLRVKRLLQTTDRRWKTKLFVIQVVLLLAASLIYHQNIFFFAIQSKRSESSIVKLNTSDVGVSSMGGKIIRPSRYWTLKVLHKEGRLECRIFTTPVESSSSSIALTKAEQFDNNKEQYVLHIHGLHHSGTGYLRQILHDALNEAYSNKSDNNVTVVSMQDSLRPYRQLLDELGNDTEKRNQLQEQYHRPEDEGQHLQSVYPNFLARYSKIKKAKGSYNKYSRLSYIADTCDVINSENKYNNASSLESGDSPPHNNIDNYKLLGNALFQQWSRYWNTSAMFLLQKSPMLDLIFLEKTKTLPTLHVIVVRHPMTSNSWGTSYMSHLWLSSWLHAFQALFDQKIEWYAVVTYEALVSYHDQVVDELLEVVRSGMRQSHNRRGQSLVMAAAAVNDENGVVSKIRNPRVVHNDTNRGSSHRRLELHRTNHLTHASTNPYLVPKPRSIKLWKQCLNQTKCSQILSFLTKDIFPYLGYVNDNGRPLQKTPGTVTVRENYGHVLFTSEGAALNKRRHASLDMTLNNGAAKELIDYVPTFDLISKMREALN